HSSLLVNYGNQQTDGYTIDVKTKNAAGTVLETISTNPFYIQSGGSNTLSGTITATGTTGGSMKLYLNSTMTGPSETTATFGGGGTAAYNFGSLQNGDYILFTDPFIQLTGENFMGINPPKNIRISGNKTEDFSLTGDSAGGAVAVTINITGPANQAIDVFAGGPGSFKSKSLTLTGGVDTTTLYLGDGDWFMNVGPQMPKGITTGPPPQPNYVIPQPKNIKISSGTSTINGVNTSTATFTLITANKTLKGTAKDQGGKAIANADVWAYDPLSGFNTFAKADTNGQFALKLTAGKYKVGASVPGMPPTKEVVVDITGNIVKSDGVQVTANIGAMTYADFIIGFAKPDYKITGQVTDANGGVIKDAAIWSYRTDGSGFANGNTSSDGKYTLYVANGTWKVGTYIPGYGPMPEQTITVLNSNQSNINFSPANSGETYYRVSGTVSVDGAATSNAFIHAESTAQINGRFRFADAVSDATGAYSLKVPVGTYRIMAYHPDYGEFAPQIKIVSADATQNLTKSAPQLITVVIKDSNNAPKIVTESFIDFFNTANNFGSFMNIKNSATGTVQLINGTYKINAHIPGVNESSMTISTSSLTVVGLPVTVTITLPALSTVSGKVTSGGLNIKDAWVELSATSTGIRFGKVTDSNGDYSIDVPNGTYAINAMKPGYMGTRENKVVSGATTHDIILTTSLITLSGTITANSATSSFAFVRAEKLDSLGNVVNVVGGQADANGDYSLAVSTGTYWKLYAVADGYKEKSYGAAFAISGSLTGRNINLTETVTINKPVSQPITPSQGGTVSAPEIGVKLTIPANALNGDNSAGNIRVTETSNIIKTDTAVPLGGKAREISATDSDGQAINNLNNSITLEMSYTKAELDTMLPEIFGTSIWSGFTDLEKFDHMKNLTLSYWDETAGSWIERPSTMNIAPATSTVYSAVESIKITGDTNHFTIFAVIMPYIATVVQAAEITPPTPSSSGGGSITPKPVPAACSIVLYNDWGTTCTGGYYSRTVKSQSPSDCILTTAQENDKKKSCVQTPASPAAAATKTTEEFFRNEAAQITGQNVFVTLDQAQIKLYENLIKGNSLNKNNKFSIAHFIKNGTDSTVKLGAGERAGVINSYKAAFGKLPLTETEWSDAIKIANGRWPNLTNATTENNATVVFKKIYKRSPNMKQTNDNAAVTVIAYGLRPANRNTNSEKAAIKSFKAIYGYNPVSATAWDIVRAIAYSGAKR
ncbi:MAG: carboxypeptidase-like regulatory domain-containing protein, partial [bacterium]